MPEVVGVDDFENLRFEFRVLSTKLDLLTAALGREFVSRALSPHPWDYPRLTQRISLVPALVPPAEELWIDV